MPAEDIRHPEKQPNSSKGSRKTYKKQTNKKKQTKEGGTEFHPGKGVLKRDKFPNTRKPSHCRICAELRKHRGQHNREKK